MEGLRRASAALRRRRPPALYAFAGALVAAMLVAAEGRGRSLMQPLGNAVVALGAAKPLWVWTAGGAFVAAVFCSAGAWRSALGSCGSRIRPLDAVARYSVGSLVNSLLPGHAGGAARIALFSKALGAEASIWTAGGVATAIGAARALVLGILVLAAWATGAFPLWPVLALVGIAAAAAGMSLAACRRPRGGRLARVLDAFYAFGRSPRRAAALLAWIAASAAARVVAATAVVAALGIHAPVTEALIVVPAVALTGIVQLTPANIGIAGATVAFVLQSNGADHTRALAGGLLFQGVETTAGLSVGLTGAALVALPSPAGRRWTIAAAAGCACLLSIAVAATAVDI